MSNSQRVQLSAPIDVQFDITSKCQLSCSYCCAAPLDGRSVPTKEAISTIHQLSDIGVVSLLLLGGEPTLHPGFLDILSTSATKIPLLSFGSNGIRLARGSLASEINKIAPNVLVTISLDSLDRRLNDTNRGAGHLAIQAIDKCCSEGLAVSISCVLNEANISKAFELLEYFYPQVKKFSFFPRVPRYESERYANYSNFLTEVESLIARIDLFSTDRNDLRVQVPFRVMKGERGFLAGVQKGCFCPTTKAYITASLDVYPCYYSVTNNNLMGNLRTESFREIWSGERAEIIRVRGESECLSGMSFRENHVPTRFKSNCKY